jgi:hypothetical protein
MTDATTPDDTSWFTNLPPGKTTASSPPIAATAPSSAAAPATDTDWFTKLPPGKGSATAAPAAAAPAVPPAPPTPSGSTGFPSSGTAPPSASQQAQLPAWAGGSTPAISAPPTDKVPSGSYLHTSQPPPPPPESTWSNIGGSIPSGIYEGFAKAANVPTHLLNAAQNVAHDVGMNVPYGSWQPPINENPTNYQPVGPWATAGHDAASAAANTVALSGAAKVVEPFLPAASVPQIATKAIADTTPGQVAAAAVGGAAEQPIANNVPDEYQPLVKMVSNVGAGSLTNAVESGAKNFVRGNVSPETAALANLAQSYDVDIRPGQISGSRFIKQADSTVQSIPFSGMRDAADQQQGQFNRAVSHTFGEDADKVTPDVLSNAGTRIGGVMEDVENRNNVTLDQTTMGNLAQIEANAHASLTDPEYQVVKRQLDNVINNVQPGNSAISGVTYGNLIHKGSPLDAMIGSKNANLSNIGGDIRGALQDSLQRSLNGSDLQAYQLARTQWKAMKTVEPLTGRADVVGGPSVAEGDIIPSQLRGAVNRSYPNFATAAPGDIPLNDLAKVGQRFLKEYPSSGTAERATCSSGLAARRWVVASAVRSWSMVFNYHRSPQRSGPVARWSPVALPHARPAAPSRARAWPITWQTGEPILASCNAACCSQRAQPTATWATQHRPV